MTKCIMQFRYYEDSHANNQPAELNADSLVDGTAFERYLPFARFDIEALPGTRFYLNDDIENPIIIGPTGIYELESEGISEINGLKFDLKSLRLIAANNPETFLLINVIYENLKKE